METIKMIQNAIEYVTSHPKLKAYLERSTLNIDRRLSSIKGKIIKRSLEDDVQTFLIRIDIDIQLRDSNDALKEDAQAMVKYTTKDGNENFSLKGLRYVHEID